MGILSFFRRVRIHDIPDEPICTVELEKSFKLLQETTADVTQAAANAAKVLKKKYGENVREKACFDALNAASDAVAFIDPDATIFFCNDKFVNMAGLESYKDALGVPLRNLLKCREAREITDFDMMWAHVQTNETWVRKCSRMNIEMTIVPIMNGLPHPIYYICTFKPLQTHK